jgi:hypothetical protein
MGGCVMCVENRFCCAPVEILHVLLDEELLDSIDHYTVHFSRVDDSRAIDSLVKGLHTASSDSARRRFSFFTGNLSDDHMCTHPLDMSQPRHVIITVIAVLGLVIKISC